MRKRFGNVILAGIIAGVVVACDPIERAGDMMRDAGQMMADAGALMAGDAGQMLQDAGAAVADAGRNIRRDAGRVMQDAGGTLMDAGQTVRDAARDSSAQAQVCGDWCTADGAMRMVTADLDTTRHWRTRTEPGDWTLADGPVNFGGADVYLYSIELRAGPALLRSSQSAGQSYIVPTSTGCTATLDATGNTVYPAGAFVNAVDVMATAGETVCQAANLAVSMGNPAPGGPSNWLLLGFDPYE